MEGGENGRSNGARVNRKFLDACASYSWLRVTGTLKFFYIILLYFITFILCIILLFLFFLLSLFIEKESVNV